MLYPTYLRRSDPFALMRSMMRDLDRGFAEVDTSVALAQVDAGNVREALIEDREQQLRLTLENPITPEEGAEETDQLLAKYPERAADQIFDRVAAAEPEKYDTAVTQQGFLSQMLSFLLPMLILFGLLFFTANGHLALISLLVDSYRAADEQRRLFDSVLTSVTAGVIVRRVMCSRVRGAGRRAGGRPGRLRRARHARPRRLIRSPAPGLPRPPPPVAAHRARSR